MKLAFPQYAEIFDSRAQQLALLLALTPYGGVWTDLAGGFYGVEIALADGLTILATYSDDCDGTYVVTINGGDGDELSIYDGRTLAQVVGFCAETVRDSSALYS
jgi:hypothetical protein